MNLNNNELKDATIIKKKPERSELVEEIISKKPTAIEKYSIFIMLSILGLVILFCSVIKYPETVNVPAKITITNNQGIDSIKAVEVSQNSINAKIFIPHKYINNIALQYPVNIYLSNYPKEMYGALVGSIVNIEELPTDSGFAATIKFPAVLKSTLNKPIIITHNSKAMCEIVISNQSILKKIYQTSFNQLLKNK